MHCPNCGQKILEGSDFCSNCGAPVVRQVLSAAAGTCPKRNFVQSAAPGWAGKAFQCSRSVPNAVLR